MSNQSGMYTLHVHKDFKKPGRPVMVATNENDDRFSHCEYYLLVDSIPVCFLVDREGGRYGARVPGPTPGSLKNNALMMGKFDRDTDEFEKIEEAEFRQRVRNYIPPPPIGEISEETERKYKEYLATKDVPPKAHT